jgi:hypothetical protein
MPVFDGFRNVKQTTLLDRTADFGYYVRWASSGPAFADHPAALSISWKDACIQSA